MAVTPTASHGKPSARAEPPERVSTEPAGRHALDVLGFADALSLVASHAGSPLGRQAILERRPETDLDRIATQTTRVREVMDLLQAEVGWRSPAVPDARAALRSVAAEGSVLAPADLAVVSRLLAEVGDAAGQLHASGEALSLAPLRADLRPDEPLRARIDAAIDDGGEVKDRASKELSRLRRELENAHTRIVRELERFASGLPDRVRVPDASVSVRDGRYVIAVRREGRGLVGGLVHDESASGGTLFVEPPVGVELMNRLRELERAERREVRRILAELSDAVRPGVAGLRASLRALTELDSLAGRARFALAVGASPPSLAGPDGPRMRIVGGGHPSLFAEGRRPVPFDLELGADERTLVVTGPNTGGKTVLLKAIGLIAALHQSGVVPPVAGGTVLPVFDGFFADIGDEQSIEASLSTFSAHLRNLRRILRHARPGSLVLVDELGNGTDPAEGAALARAILEMLTRSGATTVATTHLGALKRLAGEEGGVVNAAMQFDGERLEPTYRLVKGVPGRSYGLAIARRQDFPAAIVDRADELLPDAEREAERLLAELEVATRDAVADRREAEALLARSRERRAELQERELAVDARERHAEAAAAERARALLLDARAEVDAAIAEVRSAGAARIADAAASARARVEAAARDHARRAAETPQAPAPAPAGDDEPGAGSTVRVRSTGASGTLVELRDGSAVVVVRGVRLRLPAQDVEAAPDAAPTRARAPAPASPPPTVDASSEVDLRGLRADEVAARLHPALDAAVVADLTSLRVIHGKGQGVLRDVVRELLSADRRVASIRSGGMGEGGTGVTVAEFGS